MSLNNHKKNVTFSPSTLPPAKDGFCENLIKKDNSLEEVLKLPGDASTRQYYRLYYKNGSSKILMRLEGPIEGNLQEFTFIEVQKFLDAHSIAVPKILEIRPTEGVLLLEDLGDLTLLHFLKSITDPEEERILYQRVIDLLVDLQFRCTPRFQMEAKNPIEKNLIKGHSLFFDQEKLMWEINFTIEHFYETYLKRELKANHKKIMISEFQKICDFLAREPVVLTHRDLHSRNIMVTPASLPGAPPMLTLIDFQDARMGPAQYDLASLLRDSYYQLDEVQIRRLVEYYVARWEAISGSRLETDRFAEGFDWMSVQRNFKAIGSFASFLNRRGNAQYLKYIGNTFENVRRTLLRYPEFNDLREILFHYYYF